MARSQAPHRTPGGIQRHRQACLAATGRWIRRKHHLTSRKRLRRRFCVRGWRIAHNGVVFTGASSVTVTRYRYRGANFPTPWTPTATSG